MLTKREYKELYLLHHQKAEAGNVESKFKLGEYYEHGNGVVRNYQLAAFWYQKAVEAGHPLASLNLSWLRLKEANEDPQNGGHFGLLNDNLFNYQEFQGDYSCLVLLTNVIDRK